MEIKFDEKQLKEVVSEAILTSIDSQKRDILIKSAIQSLLEKTRSGGYYSDETVLERAFREAAYETAKQIVHEMLEKDETVMQKMRSIVADGVFLALDKNRSETVANVAHSITSALLCHRD